MGALFSYTNKKSFRFLILGLDAVGKKKILYQLKYKTNKDTYPAKGFFAEEFDYKTTNTNENVSIILFVVCGQMMVRPLWPRYYSNDVNGLIFVIDSTDSNRIEEAKIELCKLHNHESFKNDPFLIFLNKTDLPNSINKQQLIDILNLDHFTKVRRWHVQPCVATTGVGLNDGINWLLSNFNNN